MLTTKKTLLLLIPFYAIIGVFMYVSFADNNSIQSAPEAITISIENNSQTEDYSEPQVIEFIPTHIYFERLDHSVEIIDGVYDYEKDSWSLSNDKAHIMSDDSIPSNIHIMYGHNAGNVFAPIYSLNTDDTIKLTNDMGQIVTYRFNYFESVLPTDTSILNSIDTQDTLILLTCEGAWNSTRRLAYFTLLTN